MRVLNTNQPPAVQNVAGALQRQTTPYTAGQPTTPIGGNARSDWRAHVGLSPQTPAAAPGSFGSGVGLPVPHPSSTAIANFVNNPATTTQPIDRIGSNGTISNNYANTSTPTQEQLSHSTPSGLGIGQIPNFTPTAQQLSTYQSLLSPSDFAAYQAALAQAPNADIFHPTIGAQQPAVQPAAQQQVVGALAGQHAAAPGLAPQTPNLRLTTPGVPPVPTLTPSLRTPPRSLSG